MMVFVLAAIVSMCGFCVIVGALEEAWTAAERRSERKSRRYRYE